MKSIEQLSSESAFSLADWEKALSELNQWLDAKSLNAELAQKLAYLSCCAETAAAKPYSGGLTVVTLEMLDAYGIDRATKN